MGILILSPAKMMRKLAFLPRFFALFLALSLALPGPVSALRNEQPINAGMEEKLAQALGRPAARAEESGEISVPAKDGPIFPDEPISKGEVIELPTQGPGNRLVLRAGGKTYWTWVNAQRPSFNHDTGLWDALVDLRFMGIQPIQDKEALALRNVLEFRVVNADQESRYSEWQPLVRLTELGVSFPDGEQTAHHLAAAFDLKGWWNFGTPGAMGPGPARIYIEAREKKPTVPALPTANASIPLFALEQTGMEERIIPLEEIRRDSNLRRFFRTDRPLGMEIGPGDGAPLYFRAAKGEGAGLNMLAVEYPSPTAALDLANGKMGDRRLEEYPTNVKFVIAKIQDLLAVLPGSARHFRRIFIDFPSSTDDYLGVDEETPVLTELMRSLEPGGQLVIRTESRRVLDRVEEAAREIGSPPGSLSVETLNVRKDEIAKRSSWGFRYRRPGGGPPWIIVYTRPAAGTEEETVPAERIPVIDLGTYQLIGAGKQSFIYQSPDKKTVVRRFRIQGVENRHVQAYERIINGLPDEMKGVRIPRVQLVRMKGYPPGADLAVQTEFVEGYTLADLWNPQRLREPADWARNFSERAQFTNSIEPFLDWLDRETSGLADRHYMSDVPGAAFDLNSTLGNFMVSKTLEGFQLIGIDLLNIANLKEKLSQGSVRFAAGAEEADAGLPRTAELVGPNEVAQGQVTFTDPSGPSRVFKVATELIRQDNIGLGTADLRLYENSKPVGYVRYGLGRLSIEGIYIEPEYRNQGLSSVLFVTFLRAFEAGLLPEKMTGGFFSAHSFSAYARQPLSALLFKHFGFEGHRLYGPAAGLAFEIVVGQPLQPGGSIPIRAAKEESEDKWRKRQEQMRQMVRSSKDWKGLEVVDQSLDGEPVLVYAEYSIPDENDGVLRQRINDPRVKTPESWKKAGTEEGEPAVYQGGRELLSKLNFELNEAVDDALLEWIREETGPVTVVSVFLYNEATAVSRRASFTISLQTLQEARPESWFLDINRGLDEIGAQSGFWSIRPAVSTYQGNPAISFHLTPAADPASGRAAAAEEILRFAQRFFPQRYRKEWELGNDQTKPAFLTEMEKELRDRQIASVARDHGALTLHGVAKSVPGDNSLLKEEVAQGDSWKAKYWIVPAYRPTLSAFHVRKDDPKNWAWSPYGFILNGGIISLSKPRDLPTVALSLRVRSGGDSQPPARRPRDYEPLEEPFQPQITEAIQEKGKSGVNQSVVVAPQVAGLYLFYQHYSSGEDVLQEVGAIRGVDQKIPLDQYYRLAEDLGLPVYAIVRGAPHETQFSNSQVVIGREVPLEELMSKRYPLAPERWQEFHHRIQVIRPFRIPVGEQEIQQHLEGIAYLDRVSQISAAAAEKKVMVKVDGAPVILPAGGIRMQGLTTVREDGKAVDALGFLPEKVILLGLDAGRERLVVPASDLAATQRVYLAGIQRSQLREEVQETLGDRIVRLSDDQGEATKFLAAEIQAGRTGLVLADVNVSESTAQIWASFGIGVVLMPVDAAPRLTLSQLGSLEAAVRGGKVLPINDVVQRDWEEPLNVFDLAA